MAKRTPLNLNAIQLGDGPIHRFIRAMALGDVDPGKCLEWPFTTTQRGYAPVRVRHPDTLKWTTISGHRLITFMAYGDPPEKDSDAAHDPYTCSGAPCPNRYHLRWASSLENADDQLVVGTRQLTDDDVQQIIDDNRTQKQIAVQYGITQAYVSRLKSGSANRAQRVAKELSANPLRHIPGEQGERIMAIVYETKTKIPNQLYELSDVSNDQMVGSAHLLGGQWSGAYHPDGFGLHNVTGGNDPRVLNPDGSLMEADGINDVLDALKERYELDRRNG